MKLRDLFSGRICTLSNFLSLSRVVLVPFVGYALYLEQHTGSREYRYYAVVLVVIIILTDFFDGYFARLLNQVSRLGQYLDPLADKISFYIFSIFAYYYRDFPLWIVLVLFARDVYAVVGGYFLFSRKDIQGRSNFFGKLMAASIGLSGILYILSPSYEWYGLTLQQISIYLILFAIIGSTIAYWRTYSRFYFISS